MAGQSWISVRHVLQNLGDDAAFIYEERITTWFADDMDAAIALAEAEVVEYCDALDCVDTGLYQAFWMADDPGDMTSGVETFSLCRDSDLQAGEYLDHHFNTGRERQGDAGTDN
jgi:hypothetical protein